MTPEKPALPEPPEAGVHLWRIFQALNARRPGEMTSEPISYTEIDAYMRVTDSPLPPDEVALIVALDDEFLAFQAEQSAAQRGATP